MRGAGQLWLAAVLVSAWSLLTRGDAASFAVGLPVIAGALFAAQRLSRGKTTALSFTGLLRFIPFFLVESLRGGWNVAITTLSPQLRIEPVVMNYKIGLTDERSLLLFTNCVSLLPGTLAVGLEGQRLKVHALRDHATAHKELARLEACIANIFPTPVDGVVRPS